MSRPALEVADVVRARGRQFLKRFKSSLSYQLLKAFRAIERCRTAALGGHIAGSGTPPPDENPTERKYSPLVNDFKIG
jgi:hypothetical protein